MSSFRRSIIFLILVVALPNVVSALARQQTLVPNLLRNEADHGGEEEGQCNYCCTDSCIRRWKIGFAAIVFVEGVVFAYSAFLIRRVAGKHYTMAMHISDALSGGIFLATGLLHILPEAIELAAGGEHGHGGESGGSSEQEGGEEEEVEFPVASTMVLIGFYALFFIERILLPKLGMTNGHAHSDHEVESKANATGVHQVTPSDQSESLDIKETGPETVQSVQEKEEAEGDNETADSGKFFSGTFTRSLFLIVGLSIHSFVESIILGIATTFSTALNIFIATVLHRWATSAALGIKLKKANLSFLQISVLLLLFCIVAPIGIFIGFPISGISSKGQGIALGISAGIFLYVGAFDVMCAEFVENKKKPLFTFLATLTGALAIVIVTVILTTVLEIHG